MRETENPQKLLNGINCYFNFGLREVFVEKLVKMRAGFFPWTDEHPLGIKMVPSAAAWFPQAMLIDADKRPTALLNVFDAFGCDAPIGWDCIWMALANNAPVVRWLVTATACGTPYSAAALPDLFSQSFPDLKPTAVDCGIASLKDTITKSPLGGERGVIAYGMQGKKLLWIERRSKEAAPLAVLYGLYLIAGKADRRAFTVRELMTADFSSAFLSPLVAFGIEPETFKQQCRGLESRYPGYLLCTFAAGLDEVAVFPDKHTLDDIAALMLGETL